MNTSHTLRSGRSFKASSSQIMSEESIAELKKALDEERRQHEADWVRLEEERTRREREFERSVIKERSERRRKRSTRKKFVEARMKDW